MRKRAWLLQGFPSGCTVSFGLTGAWPYLFLQDCGSLGRKLFHHGSSFEMSSKMAFDTQEIQDTAKLAKLPLDAAAAGALAKDFEAILTLMAEVQKLDVESVPETARLTDDENVWREDVVTESLPQSEALRNGQAHDGYFEVPGILDWDK